MTRRSWVRNILRGALFLLPVMILLPHLADFPFLPGSEFSDVVISHFPNGLFLQRSLAQLGIVPLWSSTILSGYPFAANPLAGLYYLPGWLALLFPLPLGFNLLVVLHLIWGGVGLYRLLRAEGLSEPAALLGGLTFEALPKLYAHLGAGHLTLIYAVAWTPWLLYASDCAAARPRRLFLTGVVLGLIALADVRWAAYAGLLWLAYSLYCHVRGARIVPEARSGGRRIMLPADEPGGHKGRTLQSASLTPSHASLLTSSDSENIKEFPLARASGRDARPTLRWVLGRVAIILIAVLLAAPMLLPLAQYTQLATRSQLTPQESFTLSLPPGQLIGLVYPPLAEGAEWMVYPGAVTFGLALYALSRRNALKRGGFWAAMLVLTLIYALGSYIAPLEWAARLPGMNLLRVPSRVLFISGLCFAALAGLGLDSLYEDIRRREPRPYDYTWLVVFTIDTFFLIFAAAAWAAADRALTRVQFAWGGVFLLIGAVIILLARMRRISPAAATVLVLCVSLVDVICINGFALDFRSFDTVIKAQNEAAVYLREREDAMPGNNFFRVYSPSYSLPQHIAAWYGLELADGVDPLQLDAYVRYMKAATGVPAAGYSVTLPPFANANPAADNQDYAPDAGKLGLLNVKYILSAFPLPENGLVLLARFGATRVYENLLARPRAWVQPPDVPLGESILPVLEAREQPGQVAVRAKGPGILVLSEIAYPGWQVAVDGKPSPVETVGGLLRGVTLPAGEHQVFFAFRPWTVYAGLAIGTLTWVAWIAVVIWGWVRRRRGDFRSMPPGAKADRATKIKPGKPGWEKIFSARKRSERSLSQVSPGLVVLARLALAPGGIGRPLHRLRKCINSQEHPHG